MSETPAIDENELRKRVRALLDEVHPETSDSVGFRRAQYEHGLAWVHFPEGFGGLGLSPKMNQNVFEEIHKHSKVFHHDPPASIIGIGMGAPVVLAERSSSIWRRLTSGCELIRAEMRHKRSPSAT